MDIETLAEKLGVDRLPKAEQEEMMARLIAMLQARVDLRLSQILTDKQLDRLEELDKQNGPEAALANIEQVFPDYQKLVQAELEDMHDELVGTDEEA